LREARVWGVRQGLVEQHVRKIRLGAAQQALRRVALVDRVSKGLDARADPWDELLALGLRFMQDA
jgi:DNA polymerase III delta subunit